MSYDAIVMAVACPACKSQKGAPCVTVIDGVDTGWTHDARAFEAWGLRGGAR